MATKKAKPGKIAKGQALEVQHLVETTGVSATLATELLKKYGDDWDRIRREAEMLKSAK